MELTNEEMARVHYLATMARDAQSVTVSVHPEIALAMVSEIERLRAELERRDAENAALRAAGQSLLDLIDHEGLNNGGANGVTAGDRWDIDEGVYMTDRLIESCRKTLAENALAAKPDAAPAPVEPAPAREIAVGDTVRVLDTDTPFVGVVRSIDNDSAVVVEEHSGSSAIVPIGLLEPA